VERGLKHAHPPLDAILKAAGNQRCADCGDRAPRWASVNLGVLVCINCSGIHRNLGTHISKVKSTTLDQWQPEWITTLQQIGNDVAKAYYECKLPADYVRPTQSDSKDTLEAWIRSKYEKKFWAPSGIPEPWELLKEGKKPASVLLQGETKVSSKKEEKKKRSLGKIKSRRRNLQK